MGRCFLIVALVLALSGSAGAVSQVSTANPQAGQTPSASTWSTWLNYAPNWINTNFLGSGNTFTIANGESVLVNGTIVIDSIRVTGWSDIAAHTTPRASRTYRLGLPTRLMAGVYTDTLAAEHAVVDTLTVTFPDTTGSGKWGRANIQDSAIDSTKILNRSINFNKLTNPLSDSTVWTTAAGRNIVLGSKASGNLITIKRDISGQGNQWALSMSNNTGNDASFAVSNVSAGNLLPLLLTRNEGTAIFTGASAVNPTTPVATNETILAHVADAGTGIVVRYNATQANADGNAYDVWSTSGREGGITLAAGGTVALSAFTGTHGAQFADPNEAVEVGMIVSMTGDFMLAPSESRHPTVRRTKDRGDGAIYGTVLWRSGTGATEKELSEYNTAEWAQKLFDAGNKSFVVPKVKTAGKSYINAKGDPRLDTWEVGSLGIGVILVTDSGGDIAVGNLICPSDKPGIGERQTTGFLFTAYDPAVYDYTVAKASEAVKWSVIVPDASGVKKKLIRCVYK